MKSSASPNGGGSRSEEGISLLCCKVQRCSEVSAIIVSFGSHWHCDGTDLGLVFRSSMIYDGRQRHICGEEKRGVAFVAKSDLRFSTVEIFFFSQFGRDFC